MSTTTENVDGTNHDSSNDETAVDTSSTTNASPNPPIEQIFIRSEFDLDNENEAVDPEINNMNNSVKAEPTPVFVMDRANSLDLERLMLDKETIVLDDDLSMTIEGSFPKPFNSTTDDLMKRENDKISGDKPYLESVIFNDIA